jgi:hypothetical protein
MRNDVGVIFVVMLMAVLIVASIAWQFSRSKSILQSWADEHGLRLIDARYRWIARGPFFWTTSKSQTVYRITVEDAQGHRRTGWARCGSWLGGLWSRRVDVRWDDVPHQRGFDVVVSDNRSS